MKLWYLLFLCMLPAQAIGACAFDTNLQPFKVARSSLLDWSDLPPPELEQVTLTRGLGGGASCDQLGFLNIQLKWPRGTPYDLEEIGFEYRVVSGEAPEDLVPDAPVVAPIRGRRTEHQLTWNDGTPDGQQPLHLVLEVRPVTAEGWRGRPLQVRVDSP